MPGAEVTFQDMQDIENVASKKPGFEKIKKTCEIARRTSHDYAWVDTCCIDKTSSAELSMSINSMYRWYQRSKVCYVFLSDFEPLPAVPMEVVNRPAMVAVGLRGCKWFTRGWTLQELIAPLVIEFYDKEWNLLGTKEDLVMPLGDITRIEETVLRDSSRLYGISVASRMSWAAARKTTRVEDMAYCLLGIFDIYMPLLYGEGDKAFLRLQQQIASGSADKSLFAWQCAEERSYSGLFADSPSDFAGCARLRVFRSRNPDEVAMTNLGVRLDAFISFGKLMPIVNRVKVSLDCVKVEGNSPKWVAILLGYIENMWVRCNPFEVVLSQSKIRPFEIVSRIRTRPLVSGMTKVPIYVQPRLMPEEVQRLEQSYGCRYIIITYDKTLDGLLHSRQEDRINRVKMTMPFFQSHNRVLRTLKKKIWSRA